MPNIKELTEKLVQFRKERDWEQFHKPKDLAISLALEAAEVLEHFQWKNEQEIQEYIVKNKQEISEELADVFNWILLLSHDANIDILESAEKKIEQNGKKYPVEKTRGKHTKYNKL